MPDVFLSYSREDQVTARRFADALQREGFIVWWDQALTIGEAFDKITEKALDEAKAVVVLWSKNSVDSRWVRAEATQAQASGCLAPVMIEDCKRPIMFELTHTADLSNWSGDTDDTRWRSFVAELKRFVERSAPIGSRAPAAATQSSSQTVSEPARTSGVRSPAALAVGAVALLAVLGVIWWKFGSVPGPSKASPQTSATAATQASPVTLAVLPFANLSSDPEQEYFSDGLTEEILNQLAQVRALRVTGRTSSFSFKGKSEDLRKIAATLGVANLLEGSIRKEGDNLRITAQLIDGRDGAHLWSRTYDRKISGVFDLQDEIARDVARALSVTLDVGEIRRAEGGTTNVDAYEVYLKAQQLRVQIRSIRDWEYVERLCRDAVRLDPQFALAWGLLGQALTGISYVTEPPLPRDQAETLRKEGQAALDRAAALAPGAWWVRASRINALLVQRKWADAEPLAKSLMEDQPVSKVNWERALPYFSLLIRTGRVGEARRLLEQLVQIEPLSADMSAYLQGLMMATGECATAEREYQRRLSLTSSLEIDHYLRLLCLISEQGANRTAIDAQYRHILETASLLPKAMFMELSRAHGNPAAVRLALETALKGPITGNGLTAVVQIANAYGEKDLALKALATMGYPYSLVWQIPPGSGVRSDPRFKKIVREGGVFDYWRTSGNWADFCKPVGDDDFECK